MVNFNCLHCQDLLDPIGVGTGGAPGACAPPPQPAGKWGSAPTARAMPVHAVIGLTMRYIKFQE